MSFFFSLHESPLQQSGFAAVPAVAVVAVAPSPFIGHESPLQQQHESIAQQASAFFCSPCEGVWATPAANANSSSPRSMTRIVFLRGFILVLLSQDLCVGVREAHVALLA